MKKRIHCQQIFKINPEFTQGDYLKVFIIRKK